MIRIDLLKGLQGSAAGAAVDSGDSFSSDVFESQGSDQKRAVLNFIVIVFFSVMLLLYENDNLTTKEEILARHQKELSSLQEKNKDEKSLIEELESFEREKAQIEERVRIIGRLSKGRLKEVKSLDAVQKILPKKVWLTEVAVKSSEVKIGGFAMSDGFVNQFINGLEQSIYFEDVALRKSEDKKTDRGNLKRFEISFVLGDFE